MRNAAIIFLIVLVSFSLIPAGDYLSERAKKQAAVDAAYANFQAELEKQARVTRSAQAKAKADGDSTAAAAIEAYLDCRSRTSGPSDASTCEVAAVALANSRGLPPDRASTVVQALRKARME